MRELYRANFPGDEFADDPPVLYRLPRRGTDITLVTQEAIAGREAVLACFPWTTAAFKLRNSPARATRSRLRFAVCSPEAILPFARQPFV